MTEADGSTANQARFLVRADGRRTRDAGDVLRSYVLSPVCIGFSTLFALFVAVFTPGGLLASVPLLPRIGLVGMSLVIFLAYSAVGIPRAFRFATRRGWPLFLAQLALYVPLALALAVPLVWLNGTPLTPTTLTWTFVSTMMMVVLAAALGLLLFQVFALPVSGLSVSPRQLWRFSPPTRGDGPGTHALFSGKVARLSAENQYVRVFDARGETLRRMSLTQAAAAMEPDAGARIHRSHWVAYDQMAQLRSEGGNPRLELTCGTVLPVSRSAVAPLRKRIAQMQTGKQ